MILYDRHTGNSSAFIQKTLRFHSLIFLPLTLLLSSVMWGQSGKSRIVQEIEAQEVRFKALTPSNPLLLSSSRTEDILQASDLIGDALFYDVHHKAYKTLLEESAEWLRLELPAGDDKSFTLLLHRTDIFSSSFQLFTSAQPDQPYPYDRGRYYWGMIEGQPNSLVALAFTQDEIMGFIQSGAVHYTLGKLQGTTSFHHVLYKSDKLPPDTGINCFTDDTHDIGGKDEHQETGHGRDASNCVKMYIQVDYDVFLQKGGVQQAADYVNGAFSQVAILYANEAIELVVNEIFVWNTSDPFTGPTTSNYLTQFRNYLNGNYNGDLAHLVGYNGGGGIAYLDVLCNGFYGVGYSAVNSTYQNVPTYSWTIMVLTHEIGHNLGSPHTHACAWNGNNTAIDGCGPAAGYSEGCNGPIPSSGTIMSYCHLIGGVGINFNNGFGPQPGDLIRNEVYNAPCLDNCGPPVQYDAGITDITEPIAFPCQNTTAPSVTLKNFGAVTLTSVTIHSKLDNGAVQNYNWTGNLAQNQTVAVTLPNITYGTGSHTFIAYTSNPNGQADEVPSNNQSTTTFTYHVDWCICNAATADITPNPLTHSGSGSSSAGVNLGSGSKKPAFTITGLNSKTNGNPALRFIDQVTVSYVDGYGVNKTYGTFYGDQQSSVNVSIIDLVNSISISLSNGLGNSGFSGTLSIDFNTVDYCGAGGGCPDSDGDGVCDADDVCPGFDDNLIGTSCDDGDPCTENDVYTPACLCEGTVIPDCPGECIESTSYFTPNPLTHSGPGQSTSNTTLPANNSDAAFTISNLNAVTNGNPNNRYIEQVTVNYVNGNGNTVQYGVFRGDQQSSVNVSIAGVVQSITVLLADAYDGNSNPLMSVSMSDVISCDDPGGLPQSNNSSTTPTIRLFPNPASDVLTVQWDQVMTHADITIFNVLGIEMGSTQFSNTDTGSLSLRDLNVSGTQMLIICIEMDGHQPVLERLILQD